MYCWRCGFQFQEYAQYCSSCGSGRHGPGPGAPLEDARISVRNAVDDAVRETRRAIDSTRPAVDRFAADVERGARRVRERVSRK